MSIYFHLFLSAIICSLCGCGDKKRDNSITSEQESKTQEERQSEDRQDYRKMFGSIVVPNYPRIGEPEAPKPVIYIVTDEQGEIEGIRRPRPDLGRWEFDELDSKAYEYGKSTKETVSFVIAADKSLPKDRFLEILKTVGERTEQNKLWIQVWGAHPYPLQIWVDISTIDLEGVLKKSENLQEIVNRLSQPPAPPQRD